MISASRAIIIGCGYLGRSTAGALRARGFDVFATTRTSRRWKGLRELGVRSILFDIEAPESVISVPKDWQSGPQDVYFMLPPSGLAHALEPGGGFDRLLRELAADSTRRALLVSSTAAFGNTYDNIVGAETIAQADDERGRRLIDIERRWLRQGQRFRVCRLAGLYGSRRVIGRRQLQEGEVIPGDPAKWLNLIHVEDAAALTIACMLAVDSHPIELGSDGHPVTRGEYYRYLATALGVPAPRFDGSSARSSASRQCDPGSTMQRTGWRPRYTDFKQGLAAIVAHDGIL